MRAIFVRYLNELVGLAVMVLMTVALVAGQADADEQQAAVDKLQQVIEIRLSVSD